MVRSVSVIACGDKRIDAGPNFRVSSTPRHSLACKGGRGVNGASWARHIPFFAQRTIGFRFACARCRACGGAVLAAIQALTTRARVRFGHATPESSGAGSGGIRQRRSRRLIGTVRGGTGLRGQSSTARRFAAVTRYYDATLSPRAGWGAPSGQAALRHGVRRRQRSDRVIAAAAPAHRHHDAPCAGTTNAPAFPSRAFHSCVGRAARVSRADCLILSVGASKIGTCSEGSFVLLGRRRAFLVGSVCACVAKAARSAFGAPAEPCVPDAAIEPPDTTALRTKPRWTSRPTLAMPEVFNGSMTISTATSRCFTGQDKLSSRARVDRRERARLASGIAPTTQLRCVLRRRRHTSSVVPCDALGPTAIAFSPKRRSLDRGTPTVSGSLEGRSPGAQNPTG